MIKGNKILVLGGAGYIGSVLVGELLKKGYYVRVLDNLIFGINPFLDFSDNNSFKLCKGDIRHIEDLVMAMKGMDVVVDLAALVGDKICSLDEESAITVNYEATKIILEICNHCNINRFLFASTCSVYGHTEGGLSREDSSLNPISLYAETKANSEKVILSSSLTTTIFRLATVCGASYRMRFDLVLNILVAHAVTKGKIKIFGGNQWRPLVNVKDVVKAIILCIESETSKIDHQIFNVGSNEQNFQMKQLGQIVKKCMPYIELEFVDVADDERDYRVCFSRIADTLGFKADISIEDSIFEIKDLFDKGIVKDYRSPIHYNIEYKFKE